MIGPAMSARLSSPILIGRRPQMTTLETALERAEDGAPTVVLVGGEAGIGKSRLVGELASRARDRGGLVLEGGCISLGSDEGLPFAPIAEALRGLTRGSQRAALDGVIDPATRELARLVPELIDADAALPPEAPPEWAQTRLFDGFAILLERLGERQPVTFIVEDVHWADRSTRDLLAFVARRLRGERVVVIVTYRSDELHRRHPLRPWLAELARLPRVEQVELERFDRDELADQLAAIQGGTVAPALVDLIARRSEGNPFFAEELLAAGAAGQGTIPARLRDVLLGRVGALSGPAGRVVDAASVAGGVVDHHVLGTVLGMDDDTLTAALNEAISAQLLAPAGTADGSGSYAFRHALLGEAIYDELLASEQRRLHGAYATALAAGPTPDGAAGATHLAALAHHAAAANDLPLALRASIASARAYERAIALWDSVSDLDRPAGESYVELLYEAAAALDTALEYERARQVAQLAVDAVDADADPLRAARLVERLAWTVYLTNDLSAAIAMLGPAIDRLDGRPPSVEAAACLASLANFTFYAGQYRDAVPIAERAIAVSEAAGAPGRRVEAMGALGSSLALTGDCARGLAVLRDALEAAKVHGEPVPIGMAYLGLASTLFDCDDLEGSVTVGVDGSSWARGLRLPGFTAMAVEAQVPLGRWRTAVAILQDLPPALEEGSGERWNELFAGVIAVRMGRLADARILPEMRRDAPPMLADTAFAGNLAGGLIELAIAEGRLLDGRALVDEALGWLADADDVRFRSRVLRLGVSVEAEIAEMARARRDGDGEATAQEIGAGRVERLRGLLATHDDGTSPVFAEARGNLGLAEAELTRLQGAPDPEAWLAAAARFVDPRRPYELAYCRYREAAALLAAKGSRNEAAAALGEARALTEEIGAEPLAGAVTGLARMARLDVPSVASPEPRAETAGGAAAPDHEPLDDPYGLTDREREVLELLVAGQTNRRIAETLFISESTASVHVSNIIGKLGVTNRAEAAVTAVRAGLAG
jgi:DNA-binding CsgD family transcriptional regulator/tetratricopeptide (TPR) repeat protein